MPAVWINLAQVYFAQGHFTLAVKMYQKCLQKFYYNTDTEILLYLACTHYEAEQWQECKKSLLIAIHLAPSNYTLRFNAGVALQKFSVSTLQKSKRTADEVQASVAELKNAVRIFSQLSVATSHHSYGFVQKKIDTHEQYCKHLLDAAKVHCAAAEREEHQNFQKLEIQHQLTVAEEARRKAEEQRKFQLERRKQEDELNLVMQQEQNFEWIKEQWKITGFSGTKRKRRPLAEDDDAGCGEKKQRKAGKRKRKYKKRRILHELEEEEEEDAHSDHEVEDEEENMVNDHDDEGTADVQNHIRATGLEDSDVEENNMVSPSTAINRRRRAWSESDDEGDGNGDDDEKASRKEDDIDNSSKMAGSGGEI